LSLRLRVYVALVILAIAALIFLFTEREHHT